LGQVSIQRDRPLEGCDAQQRAVGVHLDQAEHQVGWGMPGRQGEDFREGLLSRREPRRPVIDLKGGSRLEVDGRLAVTRWSVGWVERQSALEESARLGQNFRRPTARRGY
jgi:hypothetical protein